MTSSFDNDMSSHDVMLISRIFTPARPFKIGPPAGHRSLSTSILYSNVLLNETSASKNMQLNKGANRTYYDIESFRA